MNCDDVRELLAGYVLDALEVDEHEAVARHLERCRDCTAHATDLTAAAHQLPSALTALDMPELPETIVERLQQRIGGRRALRPRLAAAAVVVLAAIAVLSALRSQQAVADEHDLRTRLAALVGEQSIVFDVLDSPHTIKALLLPEHTGSGAYGKVYTRTDSNDAVTFVNRLPQPPGRERYLVWIHGNHAAVRVGVLSLHNGFGYLVFHHSPQTRVPNVVVTLQNPSPTPGGRIVLKLALRSRDGIT